MGRVTLCEPFLLPQPGMKQDWTPAWPPAAMTSRSEGFSTTGKGVFSSSGTSGPGMELQFLSSAIVAVACSKTYCWTCSRVQPAFFMITWCSPAKTIAYCGWRPAAAQILMQAQAVASTPSGVAEIRFTYWCGADAAKIVTALSLALKPRVVWNGGHGLESVSFSAMQKVYLPAWPWLLWSREPGRVPMTFRITRRTARPMVALARQPGPKRLLPLLMSSFFAIGPFTSMNTAEPPVLVAGPW